MQFSPAHGDLNGELVRSLCEENNGSLLHLHQQLPAPPRCHTSPLKRARTEQSMKVIVAAVGEMKYKMTGKVMKDREIRNIEK